MTSKIYINSHFQAHGFRKKLVTGFAMVILVLSAGMGITLITITKIEEIGKGVIEQKQPIALEALHIVEELHVSETLLHTYLLIGDEKYYKEFQELSIKLEQGINALWQDAIKKKVILDKKSIDNSLLRLAEFTTLAQEIHELRSDYERNYPAISVGIQILNPLAQKFLGIINDLILDSDELSATGDQVQIIQRYLHEARHSWTQMMSHLRIALATQQKTDLVNVKRYSEVSGEYLEKINQLYPDLGFGALEELIDIRRKYLEALPVIKNILVGELWRTDVYLMKSKVLPLIDDMRKHMARIAQNQVEATKKEGAALTKELHDIRISNLSLLVLGMFIAIIIATSLVRALVRPIRELTHATSQIASGDLSVRVTPRTHDEIGILGHYFNDMVTQLSQLIRQKDDAAKQLAIARDTAEKANIEKSHFLTRMSHELRTPLNAIIGFSQLLELDEDNPLTQEQQLMVKDILQAGTHLLELVNEVLDLSKIESGKFEISMQDVSLADVLQQCLSLVKPLANQKKISLTLSAFEHDDCVVLADPIRLKQALINLISNAIKYNQTNGSVKISCTKTRRNSVRISVSDTGCGISKDMQHLLFKPFERLNENFAQEGSGIGLSLTKYLVELMGGKVGGESALGEGSTFWIEIKLAEVNREKGIIEKREKIKEKR